ncbi:MAG: TonB-dependent receptor [Sphingopyxis sp.]
MRSISNISQTKLSLIAMMAAGLFPAPALAQEQSETEPALAEPEIIIADYLIEPTIVVIGAAQSLSILPLPVVRITAQQLLNGQSVVISDALARIPSVTVTRNGPVGGFTGVRIRGADAAQTLVVIDGVRVGDPSSPGGGFDFGSLLNNGVERVEIQRNSNSVTWGSDAIGGVVLVETTRPNDYQVNRFSGEVGSNDTKRLTGQVGGQFGALGIVAGAGWFDSDGISSARVGSEGDGFRQFAGHGRVTLDVGDNLRLSTALIYADGRLDLDGFAPPTFSFDDTAEFQESQEIFTSARIEHDLSDTFTHRLSVAVADINRDTFDPATGPAPSFAARGHTTRYAWQGDLNLDSIRAVFGVDHAREASRTGDAFSSDAGRSRTTGEYLNLIAQPADGLTLTGGIRHDDHDRFGSAVVLSGDAAWTSGDTTLHAAYSEGYKAPTLFQLSPSAGAFGNPALNPERSRSVEVGVRKWLGKLTATLTAYRRDSRNLIDFVSCAGPGAPPICAAGTRPFGTYANVDRARAEGVEAEARWRVSDVLSLSGGYALISTRDRATGSFSFGKRLARRPLHSASLSADYTNDAFTLGADLRYVGASFDNRSNSVRLDGYALVSLRGSVTVSDAIELYGRVENLFDADYQSVAGYGTYGRTLSVGARARF